MNKDNDPIRVFDCDSVILKSRAQFLEILNKIRNDTERIVIVQIDGEDKNDPFINNAKEMMVLEKREIVSKWFGTITNASAAVQYTFLKQDKFFGYLSSFESFFLVTSENPYEVKQTDFGLDDIAFLDKNNAPLFFTTTHEGYAYLNKKYRPNKKNAI